MEEEDEGLRLAGVLAGALREARFPEDFLDLVDDLAVCVFLEYFREVGMWL